MSRRVPVRTQVTQTECGLTSCLALLEYHGRFQTLTQARAFVRPGRGGLSVLELRELLTANGCEVHVYRARPHQLAGMELPAIAYWQEYHFLVVERVGHSHVDLMDPDQGRRRITRAEFDESFSGIVITAKPTEKFEPVRRPFLHEWRLTGLHWDIPRPALAVIAGVTVLTYLLALVMPMVTAAVVDGVISPSGAAGMSWDVLMLLVAATVALYLLLQGARAFATSLLVRRLGAGLSRSTFRHLLSLPLSFFSTRMPGELMQRLGGVTYVRDALSNRIVESIFDLGLTAVILGYVWVTSPMLGVVASVLLALLLVFLLATRRPLDRAIEAEINALTLAQGVQYDAVSSIAQLKMGGYANAMEQRWSVEYDRSLKALHRRMIWQNGLVGATSAAFSLFGPLVLLLTGVRLVPAVSVGEVVATASLATSMFVGASGLLTAYTDLLTCTRYLGRLEDVVTTEPEPEGGRRTRIAEASIELRGVRFRYANEPVPVLRDLDIKIGAGEVAAIVGQSGSGKSTLAKLVCGLYQPTDGTILIGGHPLSEYNLDALRSQIGYVPQDVTLHNGTILENLRLGCDLSDGEIIARCMELGFLDFVDDLPMGYRTMVSDLGANFSGGQRQRLAIARVLLRDPRILVLDEATSALDGVNERRVNEVLASLGCTRLVIAHRLDTIASADTIHVAQDGTVVERGTHGDLLGRDGAYAALYTGGGLR